MNRTLACCIILASLPAPTVCARPDNWYTNSFYLLHEDHHTGQTAAVGADADQQLIERLVNLSKPDMIQMHAKGNPGWTTYPSKIGHVPPKLVGDVLGIWRDVARRNDCHWSIYYNIGRDGEIMKRHPEWNRSRRDGRECERALCYHSGVGEDYIWPMLHEIMAGYEPDGFWFDGSVFTIQLCYCPTCRDRFKSETGMDLPKSPKEAGWSTFHEMQRQIYREFVGKTCNLAHSVDPDCLVTFNWAYSLRMPEKPDPGIAYLTGDIANRVEGLSPEAHWYDGVGLPFDLMTTGHSFIQQAAARTKVAKAKAQIEQEMAVVIANGGRFNLWDTPSPTSGIRPDLHEFYARVVGPFLRSRQQWCLGSKRLPDVSLLHSATAHYALADRTDHSFNRRNDRIEGAAGAMSRLHLNYEMVGDWRLHEQDIRSPLLIVEHPLELSARDCEAIIEFIEAGGRVLLSGAGILHHPRFLEVFGLAEARTSDADSFRIKTSTSKAILTVTGGAGPLVTANRWGKGMAYYAAQPLLIPYSKSSKSLDVIRQLMEVLAPSRKRMVTVEAPAHVEIVLREKDSRYILHEVNTAEGRRTYGPAIPGRSRPVTIHSLPPVAAHKVSIRVPRRPESVTVQPGGVRLDNWRYVDGRVELTTPQFDVHQMIVLSFD